MPILAAPGGRTPRTLRRQTLRLQQKKFDRFLQMFNHERPHEGLNHETFGSIYQPSSVVFPRVLFEFVYPKSIVRRRVNNNGDVIWHAHNDTEYGLAAWLSR